MVGPSKGAGKAFFKKLRPRAVKIKLAPLASKVFNKVFASMSFKDPEVVGGAAVSPVSTNFVGHPDSDIVFRQTDAPFTAGW